MKTLLDVAPRRYAIVNEADLAEGLGRLASYLGKGAKQAGE